MTARESSDLDVVDGVRLVLEKESFWYDQRLEKLTKLRKSQGQWSMKIVKKEDL